jgi:hypothetical protein
MSSRVQAHCGPLPNEPTSQSWISATSINRWAMQALSGAHQFGEQAPAIPLGESSWLGLAACSAAQVFCRGSKKNSPAEAWRSGGFCAIAPRA